jgi:L-malate glycosyltransferase
VNKSKNQQPKVLHIIDHIGLGGAQTVISGIFHAKPLNKNIYLYPLRKTGDDIAFVHPNIFFSKSQSILSLQSLFTINKIIKKNNISYLHCHLIRSQIFGLIVKIFLARQVKLVLHIHGQVQREKLPYIIFLKICSYYKSIMIPVSKYLFNVLVDRLHLPQSQIRYLPNYLPEDKIPKSKMDSVERKKIRSSYGIDNSMFLILYVGRLHKAKGCIYLLEALKYLNFPFHTFVAGDGSEKSNLEKYVHKNDLDNNTTFLGLVSPDKISKLNQISDTLIIPSLEETFGIVAIEGMANWNPVIASRVGGLAEIITDGENGILFESRNSKELAQKITLLHNNTPLREEIIENARKHANSYSLTVYLDKLTSIYEEFLR